jgi:hypothetical protein
MLLEPPPSLDEEARERERASRETIARQPPAGEIPARESPVPRYDWPGANGATGVVVVRAVDGRPLPEMRVYLHPGRSCLGAMSAERIAMQFDMRAAPLFADLGRAELIAEGASGFLVEVDGAFVDAEGCRHERGVFFVAGLA